MYIFWQEIYRLTRLRLSSWLPEFGMRLLIHWLDIFLIKPNQKWAKEESFWGLVFHLS